MHQVVTAQLAARRAGTQSTKTRAEVRGGGAKPWSQKGTGRARQGSIRSPHWRGGGVALGPKPRSYAQRTPKKMIRLALRSALSDRAADGKVVVVDDWGVRRAEDAAGRGARSTRSSSTVASCSSCSARRRDVAARASATCPTSTCSTPGELNAYDVLVSDYVVFTRETLPVRPDAAPKAAEAPAATKAAAAKKAPAAKAPAAKKARGDGDGDRRCDLRIRGGHRHDGSAQPPQEHR